MLMFITGVLIIQTQANRNVLEKIFKSITDNVAVNRIVKLLNQTALFSAILARKSLIMSISHMYVSRIMVSKRTASFVRQFVNINFYRNNYLVLFNSFFMN